MLYLDASVLVALVAVELQTPAVRALVRAAEMPLVVGDLAAGEVASAFARRVRMGQLTVAEALESLADFDVWRATAAQPLDTAASDIRAAAVLVRRFDLMLRMPDAIHLAGCQRIGATLVTSDTPLVRAAGKLDLPTIDLLAQ